MKSEKAGFTLIELLVVIAIIALLMGILMPALTMVRETAKRIVCSNQVKQVGVAMTAYTSDNDNHMPVYNSNNTNTNPYLLIHSYALYRGEDLYRDPSGKPLPMKLALLFEDKYIADPKIFYCPSNLLDLYKFESYNNPKPWGSLPQNYNTEDAQKQSHNQWIRMGYTYLPIDPKKPVNSVTRMPEETAKNIDDLDTYIPYMTDIIRHKEHLSHRKNRSYAVNSLFKDSHVELCNDEKVFNHSVWDQIESGALPELTANYIVFQLIGGRGTSSGW